jgi:hypothetical protein
MTGSPFAHRRFLVTLAALACALPALVSPARAEWKEKVLYSFQGESDGDLPRGEIVRDAAGNLYGVTQLGGAENCSPMAYCGTVYEVSPPVQEGDPWTEKVLYVFKGKVENDGEYPNGGLVMDATGNLYGTAFYGGTGDCVLFGIKGGCGVVFELSPPVHKGGIWKEKILYSFKGGNDGYVPGGDLTFDTAGNLYGATLFGGGRGTTCDPYYQYCGTVFKLSPPTVNGGEWTEQVLHSFAGIAQGQLHGDGANPNGGLALDSKGVVYGTTAFGGRDPGGVHGLCSTDSGLGCGTVFKISPPKNGKGLWDEEILHSFVAGTDGAAPNGDVILNNDGSLYLSTLGGGSENGTILQFTPPTDGRGGWAETQLFVFQSCGDPDGCGSTPLKIDSAGRLYGGAGGGADRSGLVFRMEPRANDYHAEDGWDFQVLYDFEGPPDGVGPNILIPMAHGIVYGTTEFGGTGTCYGGCGTVFELTP